MSEPAKAYDKANPFLTRDDHEAALAAALQAHDAPAREALEEIIRAWDLPHPSSSAIGDTIVLPNADMERWLKLTMHPAITKARAVLKDLA
jgi:hypothetical protein